MPDPFDQLVKRIAARALGARGRVAVEDEVAPDAQAADVWFQPFRTRAKRPCRDLLDRMTVRPSILEAFHNTPGKDDFRGCVHKQLGIYRRCCAQARRKKTRPRPQFPHLWIISTGRPVSVVEGYGFSPLDGFPAGVLGRHPADAAGIVVLRELPRERETLLLRLMGAGQVLRDAIADLIALPQDAWEREVVWQDLLALRLLIPQDTTVDKEREFLMSTYELVAQWERHFTNEGIQQGIQQGIEQGIEQGIAQGMKDALCTLYRSRFGELPPALAGALAATHDLATLKHWITLIGTAPSADVAAVLVASNASRSDSK